MPVHTRGWKSLAPPRCCSEARQSCSFEAMKICSYIETLSAAFRGEGNYGLNPRGLLSLGLEFDDDKLNRAPMMPDEG